MELGPLSYTEQKLQRFFNRALLLEQKGHIYLTDPYLNAVCQLIRSSSDENNTPYISMVSSKIVLDDLSTRIMKTVALYPQALIHYVFGRYEQAVVILSECQYCPKKNTLYPHFCALLYMLEGLACIGLARQATTTSRLRKQYNRQAKKALVGIQGFFTNHGIGALHHFLAMQYNVEAEVATLDVRKDKVSCIDSIVEMYDKAVVASKKAGSLMLCAFAYELCAKYLLIHCTVQNRKVLVQKGKEYLQGAIDTYCQWGAYAKVRSLQSEIEEYGYQSLLSKDYTNNLQ